MLHQERSLGHNGTYRSQGSHIGKRAWAAMVRTDRGVDELVLPSCGCRKSCGHRTTKTRQLQHEISRQPTIQNCQPASPPSFRSLRGDLVLCYLFGWAEATRLRGFGPTTPSRSPHFRALDMGRAWNTLQGREGHSVDLGTAVNLSLIELLLVNVRVDQSSLALRCPSASPPLQTTR